MTTSDKQESAPPRGALLAVLALLTALAPFSVDVYTPSMPTMQAELRTDEWVMQATITAGLIGIGVGQLVFGPLSDRIGRRPVILMGILGWTIAAIVSAIAPTAAALIIARAASGLFGAAGIVVARAVVRDVSDSPRLIGVRIATLATVSASAPIVAPIIGAAIAIAWGWRADFVALAVFGIALGLAALAVIPETRPLSSSSTGTSALRSLFDAGRNTELRRLALALGIQSFGFYAYVATASFVVEREYGFGAGAFALVFGTNAATMLCANLLFRRLARVRHASWLMGVGLVVAGIAGTLIALFASLDAPVGAVWAASALFAGAMGFILPGAHTWAQLTAPPAGASSGLTGSVQFLGGALGSPVTGLLGPTALVLGLIIAGTSALSLVTWRAAVHARRRD